jgi:hypothetical protein
MRLRGTQRRQTGAKSGREIAILREGGASHQADETQS